MTDDEHRKCDIFIRSLSLLNVDEDGLTADNLPADMEAIAQTCPEIRAISTDGGHRSSWRCTGSQYCGTTIVVADTCIAQHKRVAAQSHSSEGVVKSLAALPVAPGHQTRFVSTANSL